MRLFEKLLKTTSDANMKPKEDIPLAQHTRYMPAMCFPLAYASGWYASLTLGS